MIRMWNTKLIHTAIRPKQKAANRPVAESFTAAGTAGFSMRAFSVAIPAGLPYNRAARLFDACTRKLISNVCL